MGWNVNETEACIVDAHLHRFGKIPGAVLEPSLFDLEELSLKLGVGV